MFKYELGQEVYFVDEFEIQKGRIFKRSYEEESWRSTDVDKRIAYAIHAPSNTSPRVNFDEKELHPSLEALFESVREKLAKDEPRSGPPDDDIPF